MDDKKLMEIFGTEELIQVFEDLSRENQNTILTKSFRKAAKVIIDEASNNLRGTYKHVQISLTSVMKRDIQTMDVGASKKGGNLAHIANEGTKDRYTRKGYYRGKITGNSFWNNAVSSTEPQVEEIIYNDIKANFDKVVAKNNKSK